MFIFARMIKTDKTYKHLFIDLDRTLWDFEKSAQQTFEAIYTKHQLKDLGVPSLDEFKVFYTKHNNRLWSYYRKGQIKKEVLSVQRFELTLKDFSIDDTELAKKMADDYVNLSPTMVSLFPYTHEILAYLKSKYVLHIITNGFEEVQQKKLDSANLRQYFTHIITSEMAGAKKPESEIFDYAFNLTGAKKDESLMIGDDFKVDILGAKSLGMDQVFVNYNRVRHSEKASYEIFALKTMESFL
jgi:putative hydrolase of the HAD superfamily